MIRRLGLLVLMVALIVSACGRQVTPNPPTAETGGVIPGYVLVRFTMNAQLNFTNYNYDIVFNTSGAGGTPYANGPQTLYQNYSFAFIVGGNGLTLGQPQLIQYVSQGKGVPPRQINVPYVGQQVFFTQNSNGQGTQFSIMFSRALFNGVTIGSPSPCVSSSPSPTPSTSPSASPTPSPSPSASPSPSPSPSAGPTPCQSFSNTVFVNFFTTQPAGGVVLDAMGQGGPNDVSFQGGPLDLATSFDKLYQVPAGAIQSSDPNAQIFSTEISNNP
jgi:hypothetical protein